MKVTFRGTVVQQSLLKSEINLAFCYRTLIKGCLKSFSLANLKLFNLICLTLFHLNSVKLSNLTCLKLLNLMWRERPVLSKCTSERALPLVRKLEDFEWWPEVKSWNSSKTFRKSSEPLNCDIHDGCRQSNPETIAYIYIFFLKLTILGAMSKPNLYLKEHLQSQSNESTPKLKLFAKGMYYPIVGVLTGWSTHPVRTPTIVWFLIIIT